jgi:bifunctional DNA-binding transcriptional regulator/antitoxin component of YhaV-PrlF toxin-antitoxin module
VRRELGVEGKDGIPYYINANTVLLVRKGASKEDVLRSLDILKQDIELRAYEEKDIQTHKLPVMELDKGDQPRNEQ